MLIYFFKMRIDELIRCGKIEVCEEVEEQNLIGEYKKVQYIKIA